MELSPNLDNTAEEKDNYTSATITEDKARQLAFIALLSVLDNKDYDDYVSGPGFPNIPFGD